MGVQSGAQGRPKGAQRVPKESQGLPRDTQKSLKNRPGAPSLKKGGPGGARGPPGMENDSKIDEKTIYFDTEDVQKKASIPPCFSTVLTPKICKKSQHSALFLHCFGWESRRHSTKKGRAFRLYFCFFLFGVNGTVSKNWRHTPALEKSGMSYHYTLQ